MAEKKKTTAKSSTDKKEVKKAPAPKAAAKPAAKAAPKKAEAKKADEKKADAKKAPEKKVAEKKSAAKPAVKADTKKAAPKVEKKEPAKAEAKKAEPKKAPKVDTKETEAKKVETKKVVDTAEEKEVKTSVKKGGKKQPDIDEEKSVAVAFDYTPLLMRGVKKLRAPFFTEVNEQEERSNKKKVSSEVKAAEKPTLSLRHKASLAEETPEELHARVIRELEEANRLFEAEIATQICTRCCINYVSPEFRVDKDLGYCEECATILKLGQSKEARQTEYNMNFARGDDEDEEDEDFDGPTDEDLANEEDLDED